MTLSNSLFTQLKSDLQTDMVALFTHFAVGTDSTAATAAQTALVTEVFRDSIDSSDVATPGEITTGGIIATTEANGNDIKETGLFDDPSAGTMYMRSVLNTITKTSDVELYLDYTIVITVTET